MSSSSYDPGDHIADSPSDIDEPKTPNYNATDLGPSSPQLQNLTLASSPPPLKRKRKSVEPYAWNKRENHLRRANAQPTASYRRLFEETLSEFNKEPNRGAILHDSQFGIVTWSAEEKLALFSALGRKGKGDVSKIAAIIGTKSRIEVQEYLSEIHRALQRQHTTEKSVRGTILSDMYAAAEISEECCAALEKVANSLSVQEEHVHNVSGRRKYGDTWLVDLEIATYLEEKIKSKDLSDVDESAHSMLATAQLFNVLNWVNLSRNVFMNFGGSRVEDNWTKICFHDESPAITCDSFTDFYTLAVSLTRRLVQSSIFLALSRLRVMDERGRDRKKYVRRVDVLAALKTLKVQANPREFWINAPRRCFLDVREYVSKGTSKTTVLSYDDVERRLAAPSLELPEFQDMDSQQETGSQDAHAPYEDGQKTDSCEDNSCSYGSDTDTSTGDSSPGEFDEILSDEEEYHASNIDKVDSFEEEKRLWQILNQSPKTALVPPVTDIKMEVKSESEDEGNVLNSRSSDQYRPLSKRKTNQELRDWRSCNPPMAEWELFGPHTYAIHNKICENHAVRWQETRNEEDQRGSS